MKKAALLVIVLSFVVTFGCASRDYVQQQMEPLVDRVSKLEAKECCDKTEDALQRAEAAAKKCEKAFELQQKK
jgi:benzoyl-CoA reductase/2-hydroxyglutaryl-CoA dehydratase subunit BcrC/BadD/HgdB